MGVFIGQVVTKWLDKREMELQEGFIFNDDGGFCWCVPKGAVIDGSSIPRVLWSVTGSPFVGKHRKASVVHDYYCQTKSEPHKKVHRMYYDACLADGMNKFKAKLFYLALKVGAPRW